MPGLQLRLRGFFSWKLNIDGFLKRNNELFTLPSEFRFFTSPSIIFIAGIKPVDFPGKYFVEICFEH